MKKNIHFIFYILFVTILFSCSKEEDFINITLENTNKNSEFKISKEEVISNVSDFLENFYSDNISTRNYKTSRTSIKNISMLTKEDLPQTIKTRTSTEGIQIDSLLYIVNLEKGFIIAGADKRTMPIFALIDSGYLSKEGLRNNYNNNHPFLEYIERTLYVVNNDIKDNELYHSNLESTRAYPIKEKIFPLLGQTKWGQSGNPYNLYCPTGTPAGCVMTTLAQVSSYYQSPKSVIYGDNISENPLSRAFDLNLNWNNILAVSNRNAGRMPKASYYLSNDSYNESQAVGLFMRYIGKMINANYETNGTTASFDHAIGFMRNIIGLQATDQHLFNRQNLYKQIKGGSLVVLCGFANSTGGLFPGYSNGHMWLADGVFVSNHDHHYFHYNWGWDGSWNGFFFEDRWNPGKKEFDDDGNETSQGDYGKDFKYKLKCSYISW